jgi:hypothetical protein
MALANPIATPSPTKTQPPSIRLRLALPPGVGLSALKVHAGDTITEGQVLAAWPRVEPTPHPSATPPPMPTWPPTPLPPSLDGDAGRELAAAQAALDALTIAQAAERDDLLARQRQEIGEQQRRVAEAQAALDALGPQQELEQQAAQAAVEQAEQVLTDTLDAQELADESSAQRAQERVHAADAALRKAQQAQERLRTAQDIARRRAEAGLATAQDDLDALPDAQGQALATLDAKHKAAMLLANSRVERANAQVEEARRASLHGTQLAITATTVAHLAAVTATAAAIPTPMPNHIVSRASGRVVGITAEEQDGRLIVTLEVMP